MQKGLRGKLGENFLEAVQFFQAGNFSDAENICRKLLKRHPNHGDTLNLIGLVLTRGGDFKAAIEFLRCATKSNGLNVGYHFTLGEVFAAAGNLDGAIDSFSKALSLQPDNVACLINLGMVNIHLKHWPQAVKALKMLYTWHLRKLKFTRDWASPYKNQTKLVMLSMLTKTRYS